MGGDGLIMLVSRCITDRLDIYSHLICSLDLINDLHLHIYIF